ncbi:PspC domain-containing protein [Demequina sp.]|uniref:PspC domain-containing protein n=1 Tax=Demequina sp. TaxID=2050685 RepID=UPI0025D99990|nr:PspC domain-containing protein [Demequina sp.]
MTDQQTPPTEAALFTTIRRWGITRGDERVLGGVVAGLAARLNWALGWTRVGVVAGAILLNGIVLLAYAAAWALLPDRHGRIIIQDFGRGVPNVGALIGIGVIGFFGLFGLGGSWGLGGGWPWDGSWPWGDGNAIAGFGRAFAGVLTVVVPLAVVGGLIALIVVISRRNRDDGPAPDGTPPVYAAPPAWAADKQRERAAAAAGTAAATSAPAPAPQSAASPPPGTSASGQTAYPQAAPATPLGGPPVPPTPMAPPPPPRPPRVPGAGAPFGLLTLAWLFISAAGVAWAAWQDRLVVHPLIAWFAVFLTGLGLILVLVSLAGRRLGFLAFLSAALLIPAGVLIVQADAIRDGWGEGWFPHVEVIRDGGEVVRVEIGDGEIVIGDVPTTAPEPTSTPFANIAAGFDGDYDEVVMPAVCYASDEAPGADGLSRAVITYDEVAASVTLQATAEHTTLRVPQGTSVSVSAPEDIVAQVYWPDRGLACDVSGAEFAATADGPVLSVEPSSDTGWSIIVIEEVSS